MKRSLEQSRSHRVAACILAGLTFAVVIKAPAAAGVADQNNTATGNAIPQIECTTPDGRVTAVPVVAGATQRAAALLMDQETLSCPLQEGETTFVIRLPETSPLDRFTFVNENAAAAGELKISVSNCQLPAASEKWVVVDGHIAFNHKRLFNVSMVGVEARYMKLAFNVGKHAPADVRLYGDRHVDKASPWQNPDQHLAWNANAPEPEAAADAVEKRSADFAAAKAKGQVVYVSSNQSPATVRMIDDNNRTSFHFAASDSRPTVIVELAQSERLHRVSALYKMHSAGKLDVYLLDDISKGARELNSRRPVASTTQQDSNGEASVEFEPKGARYVALRFTPADSFTSDQGFEVTEINAYGDVASAVADALDAPELYAAADLSNSPGPVAIPPVIPAVSP